MPVKGREIRSHDYQTTCVGIVCIIRGYLYSCTGFIIILAVVGGEWSADVAVGQLSNWLVCLIPLYHVTRWPPLVRLTETGQIILP